MKETDYKQLWRRAKAENVVLNNTISGIFEALKEVLKEDDYKKINDLSRELRGLEKGE